MQSAALSTVTNSPPPARPVSAPAPAEPPALDVVVSSAPDPNVTQMDKLRRHVELTPASAAAPKPTRADKAVEKDFEQQISSDLKKVRHEPDGSFTRGDIDIALENKGLHGKEAAALGTVADNFDDLSKSHGGKFITFDDIKKGGLGSTYTTDVEYLKTASHELFNGPIDYRKMDQGGIGDCYYLSPLNNEARLHPEELKKRLHDNGDTVTVDIPGRPSVTVTKATDSQLAAYAGGNQNGEWPTIFEKGWEESEHPSLSPMDEPGNFAVTGIEATTGHAAVNEDNKKVSLDHLDKRLQQFSPDKVSVCASTYARDYKNGLIEGHVYSVVHYDPDTKDITLRNPWGATVPTGYEEKNPGEFTMKLTDFHKQFADLTTEDPGKPAQLEPPPDDSVVAT